MKKNNKLKIRKKIISTIAATLVCAATVTTSIPTVAFSAEYNAEAEENTNTVSSSSDDAGQVSTGTVSESSSEGTDLTSAGTTSESSGDSIGQSSEVSAEAEVSPNEAQVMSAGEDPANSDSPDESKVYSQTEEADGYRVTAEYTAEAALPENAVLQISALDPDSEEYAAYAAEYKKTTGKSMDFLLDIAFYADGVEVEPAAPVDITICFTERQAAVALDPDVVHFSEEGTEEVDNTKVDRNEETSFTLESFSLVAGTFYNGISYDLSDDGILTISGSGSMANYSSYKSLPWYSNQSDIKKIVVEEGVTSIGKYAFYGCSNVTEVELPSTLTSIAMYAFDGCSSLTSISIPSGVTSIGRDAFDTCSSLTSITIPDGVTTIDSYTFYNCKALSSVTIPNTVTTINSGAFYNCTALTEITLPDSVTYIGNNAFYGCTGLTEVTIPASVTSIGESVFDKCSNNIKINITDLAAYCAIDFRDYDYNPAYYTKCLYLNGEKITNLVIPAGTTKIGSYSFYTNNALTSVTIADGVTSIGAYAFGYCPALTSVTIPASVTSIGENAFISNKNCTGVKTIYYGGTATQWAQMDKTNLYYRNENTYKTTLLGLSSSPAVYVKNADGEYVPYSALDVDMTGWTEIPAYCFYNASNLTSLEIPDTVTSIGAYAFGGCTGLTELEIPNSVETIGDGVCSSCTALKKVTLPENLTSIPNSMFSSCSKLTSVTIPESVTSIGSSAFYYCSGLGSIDLPDSITSIGTNAFYGSGLQSVTIPSSVTTLGTQPFYSTGIKNLVIPDSVTSMGTQGIFKSVTIPVDISAIPYSMIGGTCRTLTVRSKTLTSIGSPWSNSVVSKLILDNTVDSVSQSAADVLSKYKYTDVQFNGPNQLVLPNMTMTNRTLAAGTYYADENGALYLLDTENLTAKLILVPDGPENYTIPASVTGDGGTVYTVTAIGSDALSDADSMKTLTITSPEKITLVENMAFAGAKNLECINDITSSSGVSDLFTASGAQIGTLLVYGTKLTDDSVGEAKTESITTEYKLSGNDLIKVTVSPETKKNTQQLNADTYAEDGYAEFYTGAVYNTDITISHSANMQDDSPAVIRIYVAFDAENGKMDPAVGTDYTVTAADGTKVSYQVTKVKDGIYCIEVNANDAVHKTAELHFTLTYENGSAGGNAKIWTEIGTDDVSELDPSSADYQQVKWITKPNEYQIKKSSSTNLAFTVVGDMAYVNACAYQIYPSTVGTSASSYGKDIVTGTTIEDILTLDPDMEWADGVLDAVRKGNITIQNPNYGVSGSRCVERNVYANLSDGSQVLLFHIYYYSSSASYVSLDSVSVYVEKDQNNRDTVAFRVTYSNTRNDNTKEMSNFTTYVDTGSRVIVLDKDLTAITEDDLDYVYTLKNSAKETWHYNYSEDRTSESEVKRTLQVSNYKFEFTKSYDGSSSSYYGSTYPTYSLKLINSGNLPYQVVDTIQDPLDNRYYITNANLYKMLSDKSWGSYLTIDITNAYFETASFTPEYVTLANGSTSVYQTNTQDSGYQTSYGDGTGTGWSGSGDGVLFVPENSANYTSGTLKLYWEDGKCWLKKDSETPLEITDAKSLDTTLDSMGYFVGAKTQFTVSWKPRKNAEDDSFTVPGNTTYTFTVYPTMKDTFMLLEQDHETEYSSSARSQQVSNTAYCYDADKTMHSSKKLTVTYYQDFTIKKAALLNGEETTTAGAGDILTYQVTVTDAGSHSYEVLPWTDCMTGSQVLLARVDKNTALADQGLETCTDSAGIEYYELTAGTYNDVWIGGECADSIAVTGSNGEYRTLIHWYFTGKLPTTTISYPVLVKSGHAANEETGYSLGNVTWLGDHQGHRIFAPITISGHNMYHDKNIVTGKTDDGSDVLEKYSVVTAGESVTYRLDIENRGLDDYTVTANDFYDQLPLSIKASDNSWSYLWNSDNVAVSYSSTGGKEGFDLTNGDSWYVTDGASAGADTTAWQQELRWKNDFTVVIHANTTLYIYVTLTYPSNDDDTGDYWTRYCEMNAGSNIQNTFNFLNMTDVVTHELGDSPKVYLQKGVLSTSASDSDGDANALQIYENGNASISSDWSIAIQHNPMRKVQYYCVICNDGDSRLYLEELQDILPRGFIPDTSSFTILQSGLVNLETGTKLLTSKDDNKISVETGWDSSKPQASLFVNLTLDDDHYNAQNEHYYLLPGEAIGFTYYAYTASSIYTDDIAENTIGMSYYNYYGLDIVVSDTAVTGKGMGSTTTSGKFTPNDGSCTVKTCKDVETIGFNSDRTENNQWLVSSVKLTRSRIVPGIYKEAYKSVTNSGTETLDPEVIKSGDKVTWKVTVYNDGEGVIKGYKLVDTISMNEDADTASDDDTSVCNRFTGDISWSDSPNVLFSITGWSDDGQTATIKYTHVSGSESVLENYVTYKLNSGQTVKADIYSGRINKGNGYSYQYNYFCLKLDTDADNNMVLTLWTDDNSIAAGDSKDFYFTTEQPAGTVRYGEIINTASLAINQTYNSQDVTHDDDSDDSDKTVTWSDHVWLLADHMTYPEIQVTETADENNYGIGSTSENYIVLPKRNSEFYYTLTVNNSTDYNMQKLVMINNLPEVGDSDTYNAESKRDSAFKVVLDPNNTAFTVKVKDKSGTVTVLDPKYYTIEFSTQKNFAATAEDWNGNITDDDTWISQDSWTGDYDDIRSVRVVITDPATTTEELSIIPENSVITVDFNALVDKPFAKDDDGNFIAPDGTIAWETFGYRYWMPGTGYLFAGSRKVGVEIPSVPSLMKKITTASGAASALDEEQTFRILIYKGSAISESSWNPSDLKTSLDGRSFTVVDLTVKKGDSQSDLVKLDNQKVWKVNGAGELEETDVPWNWVADETYTLYEILDDKEFSLSNVEINGEDNAVQNSSVTFTYNERINQELTAINTYNVWKFNITKQDAADETKLLAGAVFGVYSPNQKDALSDDKAGTYAKTLDKDGTTYYLCRICTTGADGTASAENLERETYLLKELAAPSGYSVNADVVPINRADYSEKSVVVKDTALYRLPWAGGWGIFSYTLLGIAALLVGVAMYIQYRKKTTGI